MTIKTQRLINGIPFTQITATWLEFQAIGAPSDPQTIVIVPDAPGGAVTYVWSSSWVVQTQQPGVGVGSVIDGAIVDAAQAPAAGVGVYLPSSGNFAGISMLWNGSVWRMQFAPGINVGLG